MPVSNTLQTSFLGGLWSKFAWGRSDDPIYRMAMAECLNGIPVEEGAWVRRPGTQRIIPTVLGLAAKLLAFASSTACSFAVEVTTDGSFGFLRFFSGVSPEFTNDARTITAATYNLSGYYTITLDATTVWAVDDDLMLFFPPGYAPGLEALCRGRVLRVDSVDNGVPSVVVRSFDRGPLVLPTPNAGALVGATLRRIVRLPAPWLADLDKLRLVQAEENAVILSALQPPQTLSVVEPVAGSGQDPVFTFAPSVFIDGPYLDPQPDTGTVGAYTGSITFTPASSTFTASDVGRHIRLFSEPAAWNGGTTYANGVLVTYNNSYWVSTAAGAYVSNNVGVIPGTNFLSSSGASVALWAPAPQAAVWAWGKITAQATTSCTVALTTDLPSVNGSTITTWQLGLFEAGSEPICGTYHEGRLWLAGAAANRFDASTANDIFTFSPSDRFGVVADDNAIAYTLNAKELNVIFWMVPDHQGILCGTLGGEWLISATSQSDILTPTSIQAHQITNYGGREEEPRRAGMALLFVQRYGRRLIEFLADAFSGRFTGRHLNEFSKDLSVAGIDEIAYVEENAPIVWARTAGQLIGATYRRVSRFVTEKPVFSAWHRHEHGGAQTFGSIVALPAETGLDDRLYMTVHQGEAWYIEMLRPLPEVEDGSLQAWFSDSAPGNGATNAAKCGEAPISLGPYVPTPFISTPPTFDGDRAMVPAGTNPVLSTDAPTRARQLGFNSPQTPYFDGRTMLLGLPTPRASGDKLSLSVWFAPDGAGQGTLLRSPIIDTKTPDPDDLPITPFVKIGPILGQGAYNFYKYPLRLDCCASPVVDTQAVITPAQFTPAYGTQFHHLMLSIQHGSTNKMSVTLWVNDTEIFTNHEFDSGGTIFSIPYALLTDDHASMNFDSAAQYNAWAIGGSWVLEKDGDNHKTPPGTSEWTSIASSAVSLLCNGSDNADLGPPAYGPTIPIGTRKISHPYAGQIRTRTKDLAVLNFTAATVSGWGPNYRVTVTPDNPFGCGGNDLDIALKNFPTGGGPPSPEYPGWLLGAATEFWFDFTHFVDWSDPAIRGKFQTQDAALAHYIPVSIGQRGDTLGYVPSIYLTGGIENFAKNRANGRRLTLIGGSRDTVVIPGEGEVPTFNSDSRVPGSD